MLLLWFRRVFVVFSSTGDVFGNSFLILSFQNSRVASTESHLQLQPGSVLGLRFWRRGCGFLEPGFGEFGGGGVVLQLIRTSSCNLVRRWRCGFLELGFGEGGVVLQLIRTSSCNPVGAWASISAKEVRLLGSCFRQVRRRCVFFGIWCSSQYRHGLVQLLGCGLRRRRAALGFRFGWCSSSVGAVLSIGAVWCKSWFAVAAEMVQRMGFGFGEDGAALGYSDSVKLVTVSTLSGVLFAAYWVFR